MSERIRGLPEGEWDGDRHVHPYVQQRGPDGSAMDFDNGQGGGWTAVERSEQSRAAFHAIEPLLGALTPLGLAYLTEACMHRLYLPSVLGEDAEDRREELDPVGDLTAFERMHESTLAALAEGVERLTGACPGCGSRHDGLRKGGYVNSTTGESVRVVRIEEATVLVEVQLPHRTIRRMYDRPAFDHTFVRGDDVAVLPGTARS